MKVRTEARRDAIVAAASGLFQEMGYERASMNELAKRLGGSKATLYGYFPSKEALFVAVVRASSTSHLSEATEELRGEIKGLAELEAMLLRFAERMLLVLTNDKSAIAVYRMVVAEAGHSEVGELFRAAGPLEANAALAGVLASAMKRGELRKANPELTASQFTSLVVAETSSRLLERDPKPMTIAQIRKIAKRATDFFFNGMQPPGR
jgi:AcrR family transcriptional regulator